jgi:hypothetical protein
MWIRVVIFSQKSTVFVFLLRALPERYEENYTWGVKTTIRVKEDGYATILHIVSHTDMDGVTAAAVAWHAHYPENAPLRVSLSGYGEVDELMLETLRGNARLLVLDLFCQRRETVDEVDTFSRGRRTVALRPSQNNGGAFRKQKMDGHRHECLRGQSVLRLDSEKGHSTASRRRLDSLADLVDIANDRDLWLGKRRKAPMAGFSDSLRPLERLCPSCGEPLLYADGGGKRRGGVFRGPPGGTILRAGKV